MIRKFHLRSQVTNATTQRAFPWHVSHARSHFPSLFPLAHATPAGCWSRRAIEIHREAGRTSTPLFFGGPKNKGFSGSGAESR